MPRLINCSMFAAAAALLFAPAVTEALTISSQNNLGFRGGLFAPLPSGVGFAYFSGPQTARSLQAADPFARIPTLRPFATSPGSAFAAFAPPTFDPALPPGTPPSFGNPFDPSSPSAAPPTFDPARPPGSTTAPPGTFDPGSTTGGVRPVTGDFQATPPVTFDPIETDPIIVTGGTLILRPLTGVNILTAGGGLSSTAILSPGFSIASRPFVPSLLSVVGSVGSDRFNNAVANPEPATAALIALSIGGVVAAATRRRRECT